MTARVADDWDGAIWVTATAALFFTLDLILPLGVAGGVPYVATVLLTLRLRGGPRGTIVVATGCVALVVLGYFFSPAGGPSWKVMLNRALAVFAIAVTAVAVSLRKLAESELLARSENLERLVDARTEAYRLLARSAEKANDAKSRFLANMSHELRTPLNAVLGISQTFSRDGLSSDQLSDLDRIRVAGVHLTGLVRDILDVDRIRSASPPAESEFDLFDLIESTASLLSRSDGSADIHVRFASDVPRAVIGVPGHIRQVLLNLVGNALKYGDGGDVAVGVSWASRDPWCLRIDVIDQGPGIPPEDLGRIFERFEQADSSSSRRYEGAGLGLTISRELSTTLGGYLEAFNNEGGLGCTFRFTCRVTPIEVDGGGVLGEGPHHRKDAWDDAPEEPEDSHCGGALRSETRRRVLVVEDNPVNRMVLCRLLAHLGHDEVIEACDGEQAFAALREHSPEIVLLDLHLPGLDGFDIAARMKPAGAAQRLERPIVIAVTADATLDARRRALDLGVFDVVSKPIEVGYLKRTLEAVFGRSASHGEPTQDSV